MKELQRYLGILLFAVSVLMSSACTEETLESRKAIGYFEIALSDTEGFGTQTGEHDDSATACSRIYIYSAEGDKPLMEGFPMECTYSDAEMRHVFRGALPEGKYHVITMNSRQMNVELKHPENYETARINVVNANEAVVVTKAESDVPLIGEPESVFLTHQHKLKEGDSLDTVFEIKNREIVKAEVTPQLMVKRVTFKIHLEQPLAADHCSAKFSGIAQAVKCSTCECISTNPARARLEIEKDAAAPRNDFNAKLNLLGLIPTGTKTHLLDLTLTMDGKEVTLPPLDLTEEVEKRLKEMEDFTMEIPLALEIDVRRDINGDLKASVQGWSDGGTGSGMGGV